MPLESVLPGREPGSARTVSIDGPGEPTVMLCGGLHYDADAAAPLYRALPQVLVLDRAAVAGEPCSATSCPAWPPPVPRQGPRAGARTGARTGARAGARTGARTGARRPPDGANAGRGRRSSRCGRSSWSSCWPCVPR
ncbi:cupin domain-containing protein [Nonomuraea antimicrobica]